MENPELSPDRALWAGAATCDLTPQREVFLFGYPHVARTSTGVHDRLESTALYLRTGSEAMILIANDLIYVGKQMAREVRASISAKTGVSVSAIVLTATHTHSGPVVVDTLGNSLDPVVPRADLDYISSVQDRMVEAACTAVRRAVRAEAALTTVKAVGVGTNRHDPNGPADPEVPVFVVRSKDTGAAVACMLVYAMHPTVMHQDSTLISSDFPHFTREYLRKHGGLPDNCPILYHNGASGNQSPRHVTKANTFAEAQRLGETLGGIIAEALPNMRFTGEWPLSARSMALPLEPRALPTVADAERAASQVRRRFDELTAANADRASVRTAECDWFGAEKAVILARAVADGRHAAAIAKCSPIEIQVFVLGSWKFVFWPGEFFVEYALAVKAESRDTFVVTLANGELHGYIVTPEAVTKGVYEATNALFSHTNGPRVVAASLALLKGGA